jgi:lysyl-tRNA synthetase class 1
VALPDDADAEAIQFEVYEVGKSHGFDNLRDWFRALYETLLGRSRGRGWAASSRSTGLRAPGG